MTQETCTCSKECSWSGRAFEVLWRAVGTEWGRQDLDEGAADFVSQGDGTRSVVCSCRGAGCLYAFARTLQHP